VSRRQREMSLAGAATHRPEQLPDRARAGWPEYRPHRRRGAEPRGVDTGANPPALEFRDPDKQALANLAGRAAGAQGPTQPARAEAAQAARRAALPDPTPNPGGDARLCPYSVAYRGGARPGPVRRLGRGPHLDLFGRNSEAHQYGV